MPCAWSDDYPNKPVRLIVAIAPGGGLDTTARGIAIRLTENLKQSVVVDNRAGGGGSIGAELVARATPDGYTLMMASSSNLIYTLMYRASYDALRDFAPVTQATSLPLILVSGPTLPVKSVSELIALARQKPGTISYASAGIGGLPHLTGELFKIMTGTDIAHIPYKGGGSPFPDLLSGQIQLLVTAIVSAMPLIKSGRLHGLAITSRKRSTTVSEFPTLDEAGVAGFDVTQWFGVLAPARTPRSVIDRLRREIAAVLQQPEFVGRLAADGSEPVASSPEQFALHMRSELDKWRRVIKQAGIRGE
jgi:tripartite-type tricarboxylate transporter receptor subunit TctC